MRYIFVLLCLVIIIGCANQDGQLQRFRLDKGNIDMDYNTKNTDDPEDSNVLLREKYPLLFVIPFMPVDTKYHTKELMRSQVLEEVAYHIIAIGLLGRETPDTKRALDYALVKFGGKPVPQHFDWPDSVEHFKRSLEINPELVVADIPGSRGIHFSILIDECIDRIRKGNDLRKQPFDDQSQ